MRSIGPLPASSTYGPIEQHLDGYEATLNHAVKQKLEFDKKSLQGAPKMLYSNLVTLYKSMPWSGCTPLLPLKC